MVTILVLGTTSIIRVGAIDMHAIITTALLLIPAVVVMGYLGGKMGELIDNPKNRADADYKMMIKKAFEESASSGNVLLVTGSFYLVSEVKEFLKS